MPHRQEGALCGFVACLAALNSLPGEVLVPLLVCTGIAYAASSDAATRLGLLG